MTKTIEIVQTHFDFCNIEPRYHRDARFTAGVSERRNSYRLPFGYRVAGDDILDTLGHPCAIVHDATSNGPKLVSLRGPLPDRALAAA